MACKNCNCGKVFNLYYLTKNGKRISEFFKCPGSAEIAYQEMNRKLKQDENVKTIKQSKSNPCLDIVTYKNSDKIDEYMLTSKSIIEILNEISPVK